MSTQNLSLIAAEIRRTLPHSQLEPRILRVQAVKPGLHEHAEGLSQLQIYWLHCEKNPVRLFGRWALPTTGSSSGRFARLPLPLIHRVLEARFPKDYDTLASGNGALAVFLSTDLSSNRFTMVLAVRRGDRWLELSRWKTSWVELGISRLEVCEV